MISVLTPSIRPLGLKATQKSLEEQTCQDFEWLVEIGLPKRGCDLSKAYNRMLRRAKGDQVVILQDYIKIPKDALEKTSKYSQFMTYPVGKTLGEEVTWDWRKEGKCRPIEPHEWEADFCSAPKKAFFDVGGFNEEFDQGWSWENAELAYRASKLGYRFYAVPDNPAIAFDHDKKFEHPFRGKNENGFRFELTKEYADAGAYKLDFL